MATQFGGFGAGSAPQPELTVDQLLAVAQRQGGRVAEVANELADPRRSIMATVGAGFTSAFTGFLDLISMPGQAVAGAISSDYSIKEAVQKNIKVSDIVFKDADVKNASLGIKTADFISRTVVDVLTDPLTFVSFGASRGILGISAAPKFFAGEATTAKLGLKNVGDNVFLSEFGEKLADDYVKALGNGDKVGFFLDKTDEISKAMNFDDAAKLNLNLGLREFEEAMSKDLTDNILNGRLRQSDAVATIGKLVEKHPALIETLVDKGGIKFFGKTILSSQRIRGSIAVIPGLTTIDKLTAPIRNVTNAAFSRNYKLDADVVGGGGRLSDEAIQIQQKWSDMAESMKSDLFRKTSGLYKNLGITKQEDQFITAAIETGLEPSDPKLAQIWARLNGIEKAGPIRDEVWHATGFVKTELKHNYDELRKAGVSVSNLENYFPHILVKQKVGGIGFRTPPSKIAKGSLFSKASVLVDDSGIRYPTYFDAKPNISGEATGTMIINGEEIKTAFRYIDTEKEIKQIKKIAEKNETTIINELKYLKKESEGLQAGAKLSLIDKTVDEIVKRMDDVNGLDKEAKQMIAESVSKFIDETDLTTIVQKRLKNFYKDGVKLKSNITVPGKDLDDIIAELSSEKIMAKGVGKDLLGRVNKVLDKYIQLPSVNEVKYSKTKRAAQLDKNSQELISKLKAEIKLTKQSVLDEGINEKSLSKLVSQIVGSTAKNPGALKSVLDKLIKNKQLADDLFEELNDVQRSVELDVEKAMQQGGMFVDKLSGKVLTRARAMIPEAKELGLDFSDSSLTGLLLGSLDAIKVSVGRNFLKEMGEKLGKTASMAPEGFRGVKMTGIKFDDIDLAKSLVDDTGEEIYFHPLIAKQIEDFAGAIAQDEATESILKSYDKLQNVFKATVTSIFPAFHGRNAISNVMLNFLDIGYHALDPAHNIKTGQMLWMDEEMKGLQLKMLAGDETAGGKYLKLMNKTVFKDDKGYEWSFGELRTVMHNNVVAFHPRNLGQIDQVSFAKDNVIEISQKLFPSSKKDVMMNRFRAVNPFSTKNKLVEKGLAVGSKVEDFSRTSNFLANLKATGDPLLAAERVKMFLFDYQNLTNFERNFLRRVIPFYTFTRKNLELQAKTLLHRPGAISGEIRGVETIGQFFSGDDDLTDEEREALPDWMKNGINTVLSRDGSHVNVLSTIGTPIEQPFQQFQPNQLLASVSPILRVGPELLANYSAFHGKAISEVTNAAAFKNAPDAIKDFIGYTEVSGVSKDGKPYTYYASLRPKRMHLLLNLPPTSRVISEIKGLQKPDVDTSIKIWDFLVGFNPYSVDIESEALKRENELREELINTLDKSSAEIYQFNRVVIPKEVQ